MFEDIDIIVVGGGHAGCEAAAAAANLGSKVLLITMNRQLIGQMSCNPAMGGIAKGQIVREIDALGGYSGIIADRSMIQFRMLNRSKGPAMWSPRTQNDRMRFSEAWRLQLEQIPNVFFWEDRVVDVMVKADRVCGVITSLGIEIPAKAVILTSGTFLNGVIHIGEKSFGGGRIGEKAAEGLTENLVNLGFESSRMKTGTPPRVDGRSLDYSLMTEQEGDPDPGKFSFSPTSPPLKQRSCYITYTSPEVHEILRTGFHKSPMFVGRIKGIGPRYCPSIEDKIDRFSDKDRHQLFVEPEGWDTVEVYVNGFSSSLPEDVQYKALRLIPGFANARIFRPGYAIEYDFFPPQQLRLSLETKLIENLFFAGQINGTTGYEEAAAQGLMAGINAHQKINDSAALILGRSEAYIGVLIDDLVSKGTEEPYRMFTSRAEYRILLRQDNADLRLTPRSNEIGLADEDRMQRVREKQAGMARLQSFLRTEGATPEAVNHLLESLDTQTLNQQVKLISLLLRPQVDIFSLANEIPGLREIILSFDDLGREIAEESEIELKYEKYIAREKDLAEKIARTENLPLREDFDYHQIKALSFESREKLSRIKPRSIGQASRISGVSPADISILLVYLDR
jgi:tRNA uridine 5-carboxymethylaminomethyl modification enzyme